MAPRVLIITALVGAGHELPARALGDQFVAEVPGCGVHIMASANALVHSTGGNTILAAHIRGCTPISYGWGRGHIRLHNRAFRRHGIADVVTSQHELAGAIARAVRSTRMPDTSLAWLPSASSAVMDLLGGARPLESPMAGSATR
jgi:hypothetical protein